MPLTCGCDFDGGFDWYYTIPTDYSTLQTSKRKRCPSCKELIGKGKVVAEFERYRYSEGEIEERILGEMAEIELASYYLCERCADLWFSLHELGFECVSPDENMCQLVKEYAEMNRRGEKPE